MSEPRERRFSRFAILFHWMVGLPYMALLASGGLIMLQRMGLIQWGGARAVESLHGWIGIGLGIVIVQGAFAAIVTGRVAAIRKDLSDWIALRPRDVVWLLKLPFNILWPNRFQLPPTGRYNAGQKLHGLFIVVALIAFTITGCLMLLRPADLRPWILHSWLFYAAAGFLAVHLFLGLINRATRPALSGIFTGYVPRRYLEEHHPLVLEDPPPAHPHAVVSWRAMAAVWALAFFAAAGVLHWYGPERAARQVLRIQGQEHAGISPGELFAGHADDPRINSCQTCHQSLEQPPDSACLDCHTEIQSVMQARAGVHGQFQGACRDCHSDHQGRDATLIAFSSAEFSHDRARFPLNGAHRTLECAKCHTEHSPVPGMRKFIGITQSCSKCHADPHQPSLGNDCRRCHTEQGWSGPALLFEHNRDATFKIDAIHSDLACAACHQDSAGVTRFRLESTNCEACHTPVAEAMAGKIGDQLRTADPHFNRLQCIDCHLPEIHSPTPAQLAGRCEQCHSPRYRGLYFSWQSSLDERAQAAQAAIKRLESTDPARFDLLQREWNLARKAGVHNIQPAVELLSNLTERSKGE